MTVANAPSPIETDALIIGAGPVGLFQVFELGLLGISAHVIDVLPEVGGQCMALYPDKPIYDIPGLPRCTGRELTERLQTQAKPFAPTFHLRQQVTLLDRLPDQRLQVQTTPSQSFITRSLIIAAGVGAFLPRTLSLEGLSHLEGQQVFHHVDGRPATPTQQHLVVVGGDDDALETAIRLTQQASDIPPRRVTLLHRRSALDASEALQAQMYSLQANGKIAFVLGQVTGLGMHGQKLQSLDVATPEGLSRSLPCDALWVLLGLSPQLGPIANWGLAMSRKQLKVDTERFATSEPGIFAVGDINTYPGKRKLILSGFHEATLAAYAVAAYLRPGEKIPFEYTTASPRLHQRLGV
jgi:thioredoxin reductase (NADPH)